MQASHQSAGTSVLENPTAGERIVFRRTARDTGGELVECDLYMRPGGGSPMRHVHAKQEERVEVASGTATYTFGRRRPAQLAASSSLVIPAGVPHRVWNDSDEELHIVVEFRPALDVEGLFEKLFALAASGRTDEHGRPRLVDRILLAHEHEVFAPSPPVGVQRTLVAALAPFARRLSARQDRVARMS